MLLRALQSPNPEARDEATRQLWQIFFGAAGPDAEQQLLYAERYVENGAYAEAEKALSEVIDAYPDFAEAWNRRATLRYVRKQYAASIEDCHAVVRLEPNHFGAWHGLGLCHLALLQYADAAKAFRRALELQPFAEINQQLLAQCLTKLN